MTVTSKYPGTVNGIYQISPRTRSGRVYSKHLWERLLAQNEGMPVIDLQFEGRAGYDVILVDGGRYQSASGQGAVFIKFDAEDPTIVYDYDDLRSPPVDSWVVLSRLLEENRRGPFVFRDSDGKAV